MTSPTYLFISPHLDDAVLSCGGLIYRLIKAQCKVVVVTAFTADAPSDLALSRLARRNHAAWGLRETPFAIRCLEDIQALGELGAEHTHLGFLDAIYRTDSSQQLLYTKSVFSEPCPFDHENLAKALSNSLRSVLISYKGKNPYIFCPLTIGGHVDHIIVRRVIQSVCVGMPIVYYEDFPYASKRGVMRKWMNTNAKDDKLIPVVVPLITQETDARIASTAKYSSQLPVLFLSPLGRIREIVSSHLWSKTIPHSAQTLKAGRVWMESSVRSYLAQVGGERYWREGDAKNDADLIHSALLTHVHEAIP